MGRPDRIIDFLFRTLKGRLVLIGCTIFIACMCSGCFMFDCPACVCEWAGCDTCAECMSACDASCNACALDACDNSCSTCLFGDGCEYDCGSCGYVVCGGFSRSCVDDCGLDCSCGTCDAGGTCQFGNCTIYDENPKLDEQTVHIYLRYVAFDSNGDRARDLDLTDGTHALTRKQFEELTAIPLSGDYDAFFECEGVYRDGEFNERIADGDGTIADGASLNEEMTVFVKLIERASVGESYTVHFDVREYFGVNIADLLVPVGGVISDFPVAGDLPSDKGYVLVGWRTSDGMTVSVENGVTVFRPFRFGATTHDFTLYPIVEAIKCNVTVYASGVSGTCVVEYGATIADALESSGLHTEWGGHRFDGWALSEEHCDNGLVDVSPDDADKYRIKGDMTVYAVYSREVAVTLHYTDGPNTDNTRTHKAYEGDAFQLPMPESEQGPYLFDGWFASPDFDEASRVYASITVGNTDRHFYAKWDIIDSYEITYYIRRDGSASYVQHRVVEYKFSETEPIALERLTASLVPVGYDFTGWRRDKPDDGDVVTELPAGTYGNVRLYAAYAPRSYSARLYPEGGSVTGLDLVDEAYYESAVVYGDKTQLPVPTREGYVFVGWYERGTDARFTYDDGMMTEAYDRTSGIRLDARWEKRKYAVSFVNGAFIIVTYTVEHGGLVPSVPNDPEPLETGYRFDGWYDGDTEFDASTPVTGNRTYTARFVLREYEITLTLGDGATFADGTTEKIVRAHYGDRDIELGEPKRAGYDFEGWKIDGAADSDRITDFDGVLALFDMNDDVRLVAVWTAR